MDLETIQTYGFTNNSLLPNTYSFESEDLLKRMYHIIVEDGEYFFRGMGRTIAKIEDEDQLVQLLIDNGL